MRYDILLCGVGGQGIITLSEILATAAISNDLKAIVTQDRVLAQWGGSVKVHVRMGEVHYPMISKGLVHALLSLELGETLGYADYLNPETVIAAELGVLRAANIFLLGVVFGMDTRISEVVDPDQLIASIKSVIRRKPEEYSAIIQSGMKYGTEH